MFYPFRVTLIPTLSQAPTEQDGTNMIRDKLISRMTSAHGVSDVNAISWCPRPGFEDILATAGDDYAVRVWQVASVTS